MRHDGVNILVMQPLDPRIDDAPDLGFVRRILRCHRMAPLFAVLDGLFECKKTLETVQALRR